MDLGKFSLTPMEVIQDHRLSLIETRVLVALFSFRGKNTNLIWPTREAIGVRCGYSPGTVSNTTKKLIERGWLRKSGGVFQGPNRYEIIIPILTDPVNIHQFANPHRSGEPNPHRSGEPNPHRSGETEHTKNIPKNIPIEFPDWLDQKAWQDFKAYRRAGKGFTKRAEQLCLTKLAEVCPKGKDHVAVINQSIERGWKSFFPIKRDSFPNQPSQIRVTAEQSRHPALVYEREQERRRIEASRAGSGPRKIGDLL